MLQLIRGNSLLQDIDALGGAHRRLNQLSALKRRLAQQTLRLRRRLGMTLTRLAQQQHRTSQTLMRRAVALHSLNTLRKTHRRTSRRQISRSSLTTRRSVTVTRLRLNRRALDGAQRLLSLLLLNPHPLSLRLPAVTRRHARACVRRVCACCSCAAVCSTSHSP